MLIMRLKAIYTLCFIFGLAIGAQGQNELRKADKLLQLKAFDLAIKNYEAVLVKEADNAMAYAQLGKAYLMTNQLLKALEAYERAFAIEPSIDPQYKLDYATTLKKVGLYDLAESVFFEYADTDQDVANHMLASTEYAKTLLQRPDEYEITNFQYNSAQSDFGVSIYKDMMVFCSFRKDMVRENDMKNESYIQSKGNQLFIAPKYGKDDVRFLRPDYKEVHNIGPVSYSRNGRMMAFMRNTFTSGSNQIFSDESNMSIYLALTNDDGDFTDEKPFPYNQIEYSYAFPNLGMNGNALYFASNKPGGRGGFDIYVSYFKDGNWSEPENLGPSINSPGNEITPFFDGEKLYFSSDYHYGLGGYDNFVAEIEDGMWGEAVNMGKGINSPSDDYYLVADLSDNSFFVTSNRLGGRGKDDIYIAKRMTDTPQLVAMEEAMVPDAVHLDELGMPDDASGVREVELSLPIDNVQVVNVSSGEYVTIMDEPLANFDGAKLLSITKALPENLDEYAEVFFIQLASLTQSEGNFTAYQKLSHLGELYRFFKSSSVKIRLGYYGTRTEAERVLKSVQTKGFRDAFITRDVLASSNYEVVNAGTSSSGWIDDFNPESSYKVKLASYLDPMKFQVDNVLDLGRLEQWTKGKWTIFILGGYETIEDAKKARIKAMNRGFVDAELVEDNRGILSRVKMQ